MGSYDHGEPRFVRVARFDPSAYLHCAWIRDGATSHPDFYITLGSKLSAAYLAH